MNDYLGAAAVLGIVLLLMAIPLVVMTVFARRKISRTTSLRLQLTIALYIAFIWAPVSADGIDGWVGVWVGLMQIAACGVVATILVPERKETR